MRFSLSTLLLAVVPKVLGDKHYFFSGFFAGNVIAGVEFDDSTNDLTLVNNITVNASEGSKWIAIDVRAQLFSLKPSTSLTPTGTQEECLRRNDRPNPKLRHKIKPQPHIHQQHNPVLLLSATYTPSQQTHLTVKSRPECKLHRHYKRFSLHCLRRRLQHRLRRPSPRRRLHRRSHHCHRKSNLQQHLWRPWA